MPGIQILNYLKTINNFTPIHKKKMCTCFFLIIYFLGYQKLKRIFCVVQWGYTSLIHICWLNSEALFDPILPTHFFNDCWRDILQHTVCPSIHTTTRPMTTSVCFDPMGTFPDFITVGGQEYHGFMVPLFILLCEGTLLAYKQYNSEVNGTLWII